MVLQGVTKAYIGLHRVKKGLKRVREGYKGLQGIQEVTEL